MNNPQNYQFSFFVKDEDYVVRDHQLHSVRTLPGVTYIDIITRFFKSKGFELDQVELKNVLFMEPVTTTKNYDKKVQINLDWDKEFWRINAKSCKVINGNPIDEEWASNFQGEVHLNRERIEKNIDVEDLKKRALDSADMDCAYENTRKAGLVHYEFMKLEGRVYKGEGYILAEVNLSNLAQQYLDYFQYHPAYLDGFLNVLGIITYNNPDVNLEELKPYIPIYIGSFRGLEKFKEKCFVYIDIGRIKVSGSMDITYYDIEIYNPKGEYIGGYTRFGAKRVREEQFVKEKNTPKPITVEKIETHTSSPVDVKDLKGILEFQIQTMVAKAKGTKPEEIDVEEGFYNTGLDSTHLLQMVRDLENQLDIQLYPTLLFEYTNIKELAEYLAEEYPEKISPSLNQGGDITVSRTTSTQVNTTLKEMPSEEVEVPKGKETALGDIENEMQKIMAEATGWSLEEINIEAGFYDMGLESTHLLEMVRELENKLDVQLYPTLLFEYTNIKELAEYLKEEYPEKFKDTGQEDQLIDKPEERREEKDEVKSEVKEKVVNQPVETSVEKPTDTKLMLFKKVWRRQKTIKNPNDSSKKNILIFHTDHQLKEEILKAWDSSNEIKITVVKPSDQFSRKDDYTFEINPANEGDFKKLLDELESSNQMPEEIVFLWPQMKKGKLEEGLEEQLGLGYYSIFFLSKALLNKKIRNNINLYYIFSPYGDEFSPLDSAMGGFARALHMENPKLIIKTIEHVSYTKGTPLVELRDIVLKEVSSNGTDFEILYENGHRFVKQFKETEGQGAAVDLKEGGSYLITGGVGGLGYLFASYIAQNFKGKLILTGRRELKQVKDRIKELEDLGANVTYIQSDVANKDEVSNLVKKAKKKYKEINGVIHCAGLIRDSFLAVKNLEEAKAVLEPKVAGTINLDEALKDEKLDFFVMFSSTAAAIGNAGQTDYAFANSFMDNFAAYRNFMAEKGLRNGIAVSINWPLWKEGGMSLDDATLNIMKKKMGMVPLSTDNGIKVFENAIANRMSQVMVLEGDEKIIKSLMASAIVGEEDTSIENKLQLNISDKVRRMITGRDFIPQLELEDEGPIQIIGVYERIPEDEFKNFWVNLRERKLSKIKKVDLSKAFFEIHNKHKKKTLQMLVEISSGEKLEVIVGGKGKPVVMIPGFGLTALQWYPQFKDLSTKYQVIVVHVPGIGLSEGTEDVSLEAVGDAVMDALAKLEIDEPIHIMGSSWGGMVAQKIAHRYPKKVNSLVLSGSFCNLSLEEYPETVSLRNLIKDDFENINALDLHDLILASECLNPIVNARYSNDLDTRGWSTMDILKEIKTPTLVIVGNQDSVIDIKQSKEINSGIKDSEYHEIEGCGHVPNLTHAKEFNKKILEFFKIQEV